MIAKIITWAVFLFILIWIFSDPGAHGAQIHTWITGLFSFFTGLANG
jgi:hypothetical protein